MHCAERTTEVSRVNLFLYFKDVFGFLIVSFNNLISFKALFLSRRDNDDLKNFIKFISSQTYLAY